METEPATRPGGVRHPDFDALAAPFSDADVDWKPGAVTRDKSKGLAMCYVNSRAVQDRFDAVCGPAGWRNTFAPGPDGGVVCTVFVRVERPGEPAEWIGKTDGAEASDVEPVKGGLSGSMKRAAVLWGVGRDLYALPAQWIALDERGRFAAPPKLPAAYTRRGAPAPTSGPRGAASGSGVKRAPGAAGIAPVPVPAAPADDQPADVPEYVERVAAAFRALSWSRGAVTAALAAHFGVDSPADLRPEDVEPAVEIANDAAERDAFVRRARASTPATPTA